MGLSYGSFLLWIRLVYVSAARVSYTVNSFTIPGRYNRL